MLDSIQKTMGRSTATETSEKHQNIMKDLVRLSSVSDYFVAAAATLDH